MFALNEQNDQNSKATGRRSFLISTGIGVLGLAYWYFHKSESVHAELAPAEMPKTVTIVEFTDAGVQKEKVTVATVVKTDEEWKKQLSRDSFEVTRHAATERAYTNEHPNDDAKGVFRCICCDTALFDSSTKFESGTGWPSFWEPIAKENVLQTVDRTFGIERTAVACRRCNGHLGHVFDDGPQPTGLRYCMNSVSMRFAKAA